MGGNNSRERGGGGGGDGTRSSSQSTSRIRSDNQVLFASTLMLQRQDKPCPVCHKIQHADEYELHVVMCMTKPKLEFNLQVLGKHSFFKGVPIESQKRVYHF